MHGSRRITGAAVCTATVVVGVSAGLSGHAAASAQSDAATRTLQYLESQQSAVDGSAGTFAIDELFVIGAAADGVDPHTLADGGPSVMQYLAGQVDSACTNASASGASAGACGELIQAVVAAGDDPKAFGDPTPRDLITRLNGYYDSTTGEFGDGEAFTQALAIQALAAAARPVPAAAVTFLRSVQNGDGGWDFANIKDDPNGCANFDASDTNSTAMALMALDASGDHSLDATALAFMHTQQQQDGGFPYQNGVRDAGGNTCPGAASDPDSTALGVQSILGAGQSPTSSAWTLSGHTAIGQLLATQDPSGGFVFPGNAGPDAFTTSQVPPALDGTAFPAKAHFTPGTTLSGATAGGPTPTPAPGTPIAGLDTSSASAQPWSSVHTPARAAVSNETSTTAAGSSTSPATPSSGSIAPTMAATPPVVPSASPSQNATHAGVVGTAPSPLFGALLYVAIAIVAALVAGGVALVFARR